MMHNSSAGLPIFSKETVSSSLCRLDSKRSRGREWSSLGDKVVQGLFGI